MSERNSPAASLTTCLGDHVDEYAVVGSHADTLDPSRCRATTMCHVIPIDA